MCLLLFCSSGCSIVRKSSGPWISLGPWPCAAAHWSRQGCSKASSEAPCSLTGWVLWMSFLRSFYFKLIPCVWNKEKQQMKARSLWALTKVLVFGTRWASTAQQALLLPLGWLVCPWTLPWAIQPAVLWELLLPLEMDWSRVQMQGSFFKLWSAARQKGLWGCTVKGSG